MARSYPPLVGAVRYSPQSVRGMHTPRTPDCRATPCVALTFDDGPDGAVTARVLDILSRQHVKATFFLVGQRVPGREALVHRAYADGHEIGDHGWNHANFSRLSPGEMEMQLRMSQAAIANAGVPAPRLFRPPYGAVDPVVLSHVGLTVVRWNVDPADWDVQNAPEIQARIIQQTRPGGIILLHDIYPTTADALEPTILALKQQYQFVTVSQLLGLMPGDQGQYFGR
jgi:peptidoglycan-N-acetylglucosamine deacetylase